MAVASLWLPSVAGGIIVLLTNFTALEPKAFRCALEVSENLSLFSYKHPLSFEKRKLIFLRRPLSYVKSDHLVC